MSLCKLEPHIIWFLSLGCICGYNFLEIVLHSYATQVYMNEMISCDLSVIFHYKRLNAFEGIDFENSAIVDGKSAKCEIYHRVGCKMAHLGQNNGGVHYRHQHICLLNACTFSSELLPFMAGVICVVCHIVSEYRVPVKPVRRM